MSTPNIAKTLAMFNAAAEMPHDQRREFVRTEVADDSETRNTVLELLDTWERSSSYPNKPVNISMNRMPGLKMDAFFKVVVSKHVHRRFVNPMLFDMQAEYVKALIQGRTWHARWVVARAGLWMIIPLLLALSRIFTNATNIN